MRHRFITAGVAAVLLVAATASAAGASPTSSEDQDIVSDWSFVDYMRANPGDWEGAVALVESHGGSVEISDNVGRSIAPNEAAALSAAGEGPRFKAAQAVGEVSPLDWPSNAFTTLVAVVDMGAANPDVVQLYGEWNWQDDFIGQGSPEDIAALRVNKSCGTYSNYFASAATWNGSFTTTRASLRSGGVGEAGPIWNVHDDVKNFENLTDRGMIGVDYDLSSCPAGTKGSLQAETVYEGNDGGTVLSVSIAWGLFSVDYNNPGFSQIHSSGAASVGAQSGQGWS